MRRTVLVTGASSGVGQAVAKLLVNQNHTVIGISRTNSEQCLHNGRFHSVQIDLGKLETLPQKLQLIFKDFPDIDTIVLSAGRGEFGSLEEFSYQQINGLIDLNFTSQVYIARAILPKLKRQKHGDIIFIGSESALKGGRYGSLYCATKFALRGFTQALREECARNNVRISLINPGMLNTNFFQNLDFQPGLDEENYIPAEDIAKIISLILELRQGTVIDELNLSPLKKVIDFK